MTAKAESYSNGKQKDDASTMMDDAKGMLDDGLNRARHTVETLSQDAQREVRKATEQSAKFVRENPGVALVGALSFGILVGLAMRSR